MPVIDERLLEPDGKPEIAENFNRVMANLSGGGRIFPYSPQPGDFSYKESISMYERLVPADLSQYNQIEDTTGRAWRPICVSYDAPSGACNIKIVEDDAVFGGGDYAYAYRESEAFIIVKGGRITEIKGEQFHGEPYEGFAFYAPTVENAYGTVVLTMHAYEFV